MYLWTEYEWIYGITMNIFIYYVIPHYATECTYQVMQSSSYIKLFFPLFNILGSRQWIENCLWTIHWEHLQLINSSSQGFLIKGNFTLRCTHYNHCKLFTFSTRVRWNCVATRTVYRVYLHIIAESLSCMLLLCWSL